MLGSLSNWFFNLFILWVSTAIYSNDFGIFITVSVGSDLFMSVPSLHFMPPSSHAVKSQLCSSS